MSDENKPPTAGGGELHGYSTSRGAEIHEAFLAERRAKKIAAREASRRAAQRKKAPPPEDYPCLKPDWVEPPVRPLKRS